MLFDKVTERISKLVTGLHVSPDKVAQKVFSSMTDGIATSVIDELSADVAINMISEDPDYEVLASRIIVSNTQKLRPKTFSAAMNLSGLFHYQAVERYDSMISPDRDYDFSYFGIKTLLKMYLGPHETPQYMFMRVALGIHGTSDSQMDAVKDTYDLMSQKYFTHATPTLFNAGTGHSQLSSCFLTGIKDDSITGIYDTLKDCAQISKWSGGIGFHLHNVRATGSEIRGTNGHSDGIIPMLRTFNATARYVNQCFRGDTIVYSTDGPIRIDEIKISDQLITIDGTPKKVNEVIRNHVSKEILVIRPTHSMEPVRVTPEHEVYTIQGIPKMTNYSSILYRLDKRIVEPKFVSASSLSDGDFVGYPIPNTITDFPEDPAYFRFYGIMIGDGHMSKNEFGLTFGFSKENTYTFAMQFLKSRGIHVWTGVDDIRHTIRLRWSGNVDKLNLTRDMLYDSNNEKHIDPRFMNLPHEKTLGIIAGLMETDGGITHEVQFYNTSKNVVYSLRYLLLRIGVLSSGCIHNNVGKSHEIRPGEYITNKKISWSVRIPKHPNLRPIFGDSIEYSTTVKFLEWNGILWSRIKRIGKEHFDGYVYDLNMQDNHNYLTDMGLVHNSGKRKGSFAAYLEPWHSDIFEFLELRLNQGDEEARCRDLFTALWIPDLFMKRLGEGKPWSLFCPDKAPGLSDVWGDKFEKLYLKYESMGLATKTIPIEQLWSAILKSQIETGTPYMLYKDHCNRKSNQRHLGTIKSSNLCVAPETKILTKYGYKTISDLVDQSVEVWNGEEWSEVTVRKTSEESALMRVELDNGTFLECTPDHKFWVKPDYFSKPEEVRAADLNMNDKLVKWDCPVIEFGSDDFKYPYTHGFFCGDGTYHKTYSGEAIHPGVSLYHEKMKLLPYLEVRSTSGIPDSSGRINCLLPFDLPQKFIVPLNYSVKVRLEWLSGLLDADGTVLKSGHFQLASIHKNFLHDIQLMLNTLGVQSKVSLVHTEAMRCMPDGRGGKSMFKCQALWRLFISQTYAHKLIQLGLTTHRLTMNSKPGNRVANWYAKVASVLMTGRLDATYCFTEPKRHMGVFNGILTGQCTEIIEYTDPGEIAVCNLASICLPKFVNESDGTFDYVKLEEVTRTVTRNLDKIIDVNFYPVPEAERSNKKHRPVAIGVQGLADVYQMLGLDFGQGDLNRLVFETIYWAACSESVRIAEVKGPHSSFSGSPWSQGLFQFDLWGVTPSDRYDWESIRGRPIRNSLLVGPMPTATTSQIMGNNECFEPYTSNMYLRRTLAGEFVVLNKHLVTDLKALGIWSKQVKDDIVRNQGSVQTLDIPEDLKNRYKTVWEISQKIIIDMAAERGPYICQSQSMNLHVEDPTASKLSSIHMYAWKKGLKTGMYYLRTRPKARAIQFTLEPEAAPACRRDNPGCISCSG
jgi:ribonucleoside-diphosphate reductase alpha chain